MRRRSRSHLAALLCLSAAACSSRCGGAPSTNAAPGQHSPPAPRAVQVGLPSADLRQAVMLATPEFRGMTGLYNVAVVERRYEGAAPEGGAAAVAALLSPGFAAKSWRPAQADGGPLAAQSEPFFLEADVADGHPLVRVGLVIPGEKVADVLQTPAPLTSQALSLRMPPLPGAGRYDERFVYEVHYRAQPEGSARLFRQLSAGLRGAGWAAPDGGLLEEPDAGLPEQLEETLSGPYAATLTLKRVGERATVTWVQPLTTGTR